MIKVHHRLILARIQWTNLDGCFPVKERCVCVSIYKSVSLWCTAECYGEIVSGPLRTPCRWTSLSMQSHLLRNSAIDSSLISNTGWLIWSHSSDPLALGEQSEGGRKSSSQWNRQRDRASTCLSFRFSLAARPQRDSPVFCCHCCINSAAPVFWWAFTFL